MRLFLYTINSSLIKGEFYLEAINSLTTYRDTGVIITATNGWGVANATVNMTGYDAYAFVATQTREAYGMQWHATGAGDNVKELKLSSAGGNWTRGTVIVNDKTRGFTLTGLGYNGDSAASCAWVTFSLVPYQLN